MTKRPEPADAIDAYTEWATASIDAWAASAVAMSDAMDRGSYSAAEWVAQTGAWAGRMAQASMDLYESLLTGARGSTVVSEEFQALPTQASGASRELRLAGPMQAMTSPATIAVAAVRIVPATLQGASSSFRLEVDPATLPGDAYWGKVDVLGAGAVLETVDVVVQVP